MTKKELLDRFAHSGEERVLLARALDKLELAQNRGVPAQTPFLSPGEQAALSDLLSAWGRPRHLFWGGYPDAERRICAFLPDWQEEDGLLSDPEGPLAALEARFPPEAGLEVAAQAVAELRAGEFSSVYNTADGAGFSELLKRIPADMKEFAAKKEQYELMCRSYKEQLARQAFEEELSAQCQLLPEYRQR